MRIGITGGTGFVGGHLATSLAGNGHQVVVVARGVDQRPWAQSVLKAPGVIFELVGTEDRNGLARAFGGCEAIAHCAGINREIGAQTYEAVHVQGTSNVIHAAETVGAKRLVLVSFLRARPDCGSGYHESKWAAEELVRASQCDWTVVKPGMIYGKGDHMLDHLSHALTTFPVFLGVGERRVRPLAVQDLLTVVEAGLLDARLVRRTVAVVGPTEIGFDDAARLVARLIDKKRRFVALPIGFHYLLARLSERLMTVPLIARAQVRILEEEVIEPVNAPDRLPSDLEPATEFDERSIRLGLPEPGRFGLNDLRWFAGRS